MKRANIIILILIAFIILVLLIFYFNSKGNTDKLTISKDGNIGNTMENLQNLGWITQDDQYAYSVYLEQAQDKLKWNIYKSDFDGSNKMFIYEAQASFLNVIDGWIYYIDMGDKSKIYKVDINGQNHQKISDISVSYLAANKDILYAIGVHDEYNNNLYAINADGSNVRILSDEQVRKIYFYNDYIYFVSQRERNTLISKMDLIGENKELISNNIFGGVGWWTIYNDTIFYLNQSTPSSLNKISIAGQNPATIIDMEHYIPSTLTSNKNIFYYSTRGSIFGGNTVLHQLDLETGIEKTKKVRIIKKASGGHITYSDFLIGDKIYRMENGQLLIMDSDGRNVKHWSY